MGCWDDGGGWVRVGVRGWAISSSGRTAPRSGNMSLSGRYPEHDICEDFNAIDVRELQRKTQMRPGLCFIKEWFRNGAPAGEVSIFIHPDAVILVHRARYPGSTESRIIELQVPIIWTKCHLGGRAQTPRGPHPGWAIWSKATARRGHRQHGQYMRRAPCKRATGMASRTLPRAP